MNEVIESLFSPIVQNFDIGTMLDGSRHMISVYGACSLCQIFEHTRFLANSYFFHGSFRPSADIVKPANPLISLVNNGDRNLILACTPGT